MQAPKATVARTPIRSASQPIRMPPAPVPTQASEPASTSTERSVPSASSIGFRPTTISSGEPKETERIASVSHAARHERGPSMLVMSSPSAFSLAPRWWRRGRQCLRDGGNWLRRRLHGG